MNQSVQKKSVRRRIASRAVLGAVLFMSLGGAIDAAALQNVPVQPRPSAPGPSLFAQHASQAGVKRCAAVYPALGAMVAEGSTYNVASSWNKQAPDAHPVQGLVGLSLKNAQYQGPAAGVVFAAPTASGCVGDAVRVIPFAQSCPLIVKQLPAGSHLLRDMEGSALYEVGGTGGQVMLIGGKAGCTAISVNQIG
jgi:hypothetical protein